MPRQTLSAAEAARALGISVDTLRRWDRDGQASRVERDAANRRVVPAAEVERLRGAARRRDAVARATASAASSARVEVDGLLAQVEIDVTEPSRVVAIVTRESVEELGLEAGHERGGGREVDLGDGGAVRRGLASARRSSRRSRSSPASPRPRAERPGDRLRRRLADRGLPAESRPAPRFQLRRLEPARAPDRAAARRPTSSPRRARTTRRSSSATGSSRSRARSRPTRSS